MSVRWIQIRAFLPTDITNRTAAGRRDLSSLSSVLSRKTGASFHPSHFDGSIIYCAPGKGNYIFFPRYAFLGRADPGCWD